MSFFTGDFEIWLTGSLGWGPHCVGASLCGGSVGGTWEEGSLAGDSVGYVEKGSGDGHLLP